MNKDVVIWAALSVCLFASGCFSYGYTPYYQPGTYGTVPPAAYGPRPVGPMTVPPGSVWVPANQQPGPVAGVPLPEPVRRPATASTDKFEEPAGKPVPDPVEPGKPSKPEEVTEPFGLNADPNADRPFVQVRRRKRITRPEDLELAVEPDRVQLASSESRLSAEHPEIAGTVQSAEFTTRVVSKPEEPVEQFGYDAQRYSWLQGILERGRSGMWHLVYSPTPDATDQFGGEVTLKQNPILDSLKNRTIIRVEGQFDPEARDRLGKPMYEVNPRSVEVVSP